jgi:flagellar protein FlgJ
MTTLAPLTPTPLTPPGANVPEGVKAKLKEKAQEFESYFLQQFIGLTMPDMSDDPIFGGGFAEQTFNTKLQEEMASSMARKGGLGLTQRVYAELLKAQEAYYPPVTQPTH